MIAVNLYDVEKYVQLVIPYLDLSLTPSPFHVHIVYELPPILFYLTRYSEIPATIEFH